MPSEIFWLTLSAVNTALLVYIYAPPRVRRIGLVRVFTSPLPGDDPFPKGEEWAARAYRAHMNSVENLVVFAPLVLAVHVTGISNDVTLWASAIFFWARLAYGILYVLNTPLVRFPLYLTGLVACLVLAYQLLAGSV